MTDKHTPGPWTVSVSGKENENCTVVADGIPVAIVNDDNGNFAFKAVSEIHANARLIAAAPDLLAALDVLLYPEKHLVNVATARERAQDAIAKARGEG
jgi:hypothetical protein